MSEVRIAGWGAVTPAGWGLEPLRQVLTGTLSPEVRNLERPGWTHPLHARLVPAPSPRPSFMRDARLRRSSPITMFALAAALEALGEDVHELEHDEFRLGIIFCTWGGCVQYSRRFYAEVVQDPATASPLFFPETVFNAPTSHLAAYLKTNAATYTLAGDQSTFVQALALAGQWLLSGRVHGCLVVGAEESDWLISNALHLFDRSVIGAEGAGALYLKQATDGTNGVTLDLVTQPESYSPAHPRAQAARCTRAHFPKGNDRTVLCDGLINLETADRDESSAWQDWLGARVSVKQFLGEGFGAGSAWQCVVAADLLAGGTYDSAITSVIGHNEHAVGARFQRDRAGCS